MPIQKPIRRNFGKKESNLPQLDLISVQKESWQWFLTEAIKRELAEISPIEDFTGKNWQLFFDEPTLGDPKITSRDALERGLTYSISFKIKATLVNKKNGRRVTQQVFLGEIPQMLSRGTFVINGVERAVINQLVRSPGMYFSGDLDASSGRMLYISEIRPLRGTWLQFEVTKNDVIAARIDRRKKVPATTILRAMGVESDSEIFSLFKIKSFGDFTESFFSIFK